MDRKLERVSVVLAGLLILTLLAVGCGSPAAQTPSDVAAPALLPNLLVQVQGEVWLRRAGWNDFQPAGFGATVFPGDLVRVAEGATAAVFCGDEAAWEENPQSLPGDGAEHGVPCQAGRPPRPWPDAAALRGEVDTTIPYVIYPRDSALLTDRPPLRWNNLSGVRTYTISLLGNDGLERPPIEVDGAHTSWPEAWPPLEMDSTYVLLVEGGGRRSNEYNETNAGLGFWLLPAEEAEEVRAQEDRLRARPLEARAVDLLVAELYRSYGLYTEATILLTSLAVDEPAAAVWLKLGQLFLKTDLVVPAHVALQQAVAAAQDTAERAIEAEAHLGVGLAARLMNDEKAAQEHLQAARALYEQIGDQDGVEQVEQRLAE